MTDLKDKTKEAPKLPGVYRFIDASGEILYVGKAKNLQNRLRQYFLKELGRGPAIAQMVEKAARIEWSETDSEIEAVILEADLIKKLKPKYNVRLKDDKSFLAIKIAKKISKSSPPAGGLIPKQILNSKYKSQTKKPASNETIFPAIELVRYKDVDLSDKSAEFFGPYPAGLLLKKSLRYLRKIFPYRDCSKTKYNTYKKRNRSCIYGDIRVCTAPCVGWVGEERYLKNIRYLKNFLKGRKKVVIADLQKEMVALSRDKKFEEAALVRNQLQALNHLKEVAIGLRDDVFTIEHTLFKRIECYDISNLGEEFAVGSMVVFVDGKAENGEYRKFKIKNAESRIQDSAKPLTPPSLPSHDQEGRGNKSDLERLQQVLQRRFKNNWSKPDLIIIDGGEMQLKVAKEVLKEFELNISLISISKGKERKKNDFHYADSNLAKYFSKDKALQNIAISARDEAHRFAISYYRKLHQKSVLEG
jgi:excinuclease ABC subunit C